MPGVSGLWLHEPLPPHRPGSTRNRGGAAHEFTLGRRAEQRGEMAQHEQRPGEVAERRARISPVVWRWRPKRTLVAAPASTGYEPTTYVLLGLRRLVCLANQAPSSWPSPVVCCIS